MIFFQKIKLEEFTLINDWVKSEEELIQFAGPAFKYPVTKEQFKNYLEDVNRHPFKVLLSENEQVVGMCELFDVSDKVARICRVLIGDESMRGKGLGGEVIKKLVDFSFNNLGKEITTLNVYAWNKAAIRCYEKVGFKITNKELPPMKLSNGKEWSNIQMKIDKD